MNDDQPPQFPQYPPQGLPHVDPKEQKPLNKMLKFMAKPLKARDPFHSRRPKTRKMKTVRYY
jgi:hypothetical protein